MNQDVTKILSMVAEGKISVEEGQKLIEALQTNAPVVSTNAGVARTKANCRFLHVVVDSHGKNGDSANVNVRVPLKLLRAGIKLGALVPPEARDQVENALEEKGFNLSLSNLKSEDLDDLIECLQEMEVNVNSDEAKVRVYCE